MDAHVPPLRTLPSEVLQRVLRMLTSRKGGLAVRLTCTWLRDAHDACNHRLVLGGQARQHAPPMPNDTSLRLRLLAIVRASLCVNSLVLQPHCTLLSLPDAMDVGGARLCGSLKKLVVRGRKELLDLAPLAPCLALGHLDLSSCSELEQLAPLAALTSLRHLNLHGCAKVRDVAPLSALVGLQHLDLGDSRITSVAPLAACTALQHLNLACCLLLKDVGPLSSCTSLRHVNLRGTSFSVDLGPVIKLAGCKVLG